MIIVPIQWFGLGDIIFEQTLVRKIAKGNAIMWPSDALFVEGLNRAYPDITFIDRAKADIDYECKEDYVKNAMRFLPLRWADTILKVPYSQCMASKYALYDMDYRIWKEKAMWRRDEEKEDELYKLLQCDKKEYNLVNSFFGSQSQLRVSIEVSNGLPNINMGTVQGYSLFDWAKVIENASTINVVSSSIIYILEMLALKAPEVHLYCRKPIEHDFKTIDYIFEKHKYIQHL